jgi:outer membrane lipoprotein SlyB
MEYIKDMVSIVSTDDEKTNEENLEMLATQIVEKMEADVSTLKGENMKMEPEVKEQKKAEIKSVLKELAKIN